MKTTARVVILGAGTAGISAYKEAVRHVPADDVLLVDPGPLGTTCARVGCMPSKAFLRIAGDVHRSRRLFDDGFAAGQVGGVDPARPLMEVRRLRDQFAAGPRRWTEGLGDRFISGAARFVGPDSIEVNGQTIRADVILAATGSRPVVPDAWTVARERVWTTDELFEQERLPGSLAVVGLGAIGLELGQALVRLGVDVQAFGRGSHLAGLSDEPVNDALLQSLSSELPIHTGTEIDVSEGSSGVRVSTGHHAFDAEVVLAAVGRRPVLAELGPEALGVELDDRGLPVSDPDSFQIPGTSVYLVGDVNGRVALMHEAADEGRLAAYRALAPEPTCLARRTPLAIVFTEPGVARVGTPYAGLPPDARVGTADFRSQGRAILMDEASGVLRVYADAKGVLIGAEMAVPRAEHLAHELAWLIQEGIDVERALSLPYYHPVLEEGLRGALQDLRRQLPDRPLRPDLPLCGDRMI